VKKRLFLAFVCIIAVLSCEVPQSVTIKGKPGLYVPLGNPFNKLGPGERLEGFLTLEKVREMMGSEDGEVYVYDYRGSDVDPNVQAYLAHYPLARMNLKLQEYVDEALLNDDGEPISFDIPPQYSNEENWDYFRSEPDYVDGLYLAGEEGIKTSEGEPTFKIALVDMAKLVKKVEGTFGFETPYDPSLAAHLQVKIPAFGITSYIPGVQKDDMLQFLEEDTTIHPQTDLSETNGFLYIYIKMVGPCSGQIESDVVFDWTEAIIDTVDESFEGEYQIKNSLKEFLGSGVDFKEVKSYIYVDGIEDDGALLNLEHVYKDDNDIIITDSLANGELEPKSWQPVTGDIFTKSISTLYHSLKNEEHIDLTNVLNRNEASSLKHQILIEEMEVINNEALDKMFSADLVILIVMDFKVHDEDPMVAGYSKLEMGGALPDPGDKDLFARKGTDDDFLNNMEMVKISLKKIEKGVVDGKLTILVVNPNQKTGKAKYHRINIDSPDPSLTLKMDELPFPFTPKFKILLKNESEKDYAELRIKRKKPGDKPVGFSLTIESRADLNYTVEF
jgi:hypothetical protein